MAGWQDKSEKGTPGLLFRQRLEYGVGLRSLAGKWDLLWSMHSHQVSANPADTGGEKPANCEHTLPELLKINDKELMDHAVISTLSDSAVVTGDQRILYTKVLSQCLKRIDEINYRGNLLENVKASEGVPLP
jgi:hypothetical protein